MMNNPHKCINPGYKRELEQISRAIKLILLDMKFLFLVAQTLLSLQSRLETTR